MTKSESDMFTMTLGTKVPCLMLGMYPRLREFVDNNPTKFKYNAVSQYHEYIGLDTAITLSNQRIKEPTK